MLLLIDKPQGITSHDVIYKLRKLLGEKRIGHAGTLDPNATGLLIVGVGREFTKKLGELTTGTTKTYEAEIVLGATSTTEDAEGEIINSNSQAIPEKHLVEEILKTFEGEQFQVPSSHSAIKIEGKKAYQLARKGLEVKLEPRKIVIHSIKLVEYEYPILKLECEVSAGTYIRALARDIGKKLETGAYLKNLRRTKIGEFSVTNAVRLDNTTDYESILRNYIGDNSGNN